LKYGPSGLLEISRKKQEKTTGDRQLFYESVSVTLDAACRFIKRYSQLASEMAKEEKNKSLKENLEKISGLCDFLANNPPADFRGALQSSGFFSLFCIWNLMPLHSHQAGWINTFTRFTEMISIQVKLT